MRNLVIIVIILLSLEYISAKTTLIGGHFDKPKDSTVTIQYYSSAINFIEGATTKQEVILDEKNNFLFEIETDIPINFHLLNGEKWLFMNKYAAIGDSVYFNFKDSSMVFTAKCEECLNFMFEWEDKFLRNPKVRKEYNSSYDSFEPIQFSAYWFKRKNDQLAFFNEFFQGKKYPEDFKQYMEAEINYSFATALLQYSWRNPLGKGVLKNQEYIKFLDSITIDNPTAITNQRYLFFLRELPYNFIVFTNHDSTNNKEVNEYANNNEFHIYDSLATKYFKGATYDLSIYKGLISNIEMLSYFKGDSTFDLKYNKLLNNIEIAKNNFNDKSYYNRLKEKLNDFKSDNKLAPDFKLLDLNGKEVKLSDYRGKVVYLDFWGTNCAPCVAQIPAANQLKERFKDRDVVFLYIAFDTSVDKLKRFIDAKSFKGVHLIEKKGFASNVADAYKINSIPHYFLIDKKGYIVNSNAPRPSDKPDQIIENELMK